MEYDLRNFVNPQDPKGVRKCYAVLANPKTIGLKELSEEWREKTGVSRTDAIASITLMTDLLAGHLKKGNRVQFGEIGTFSVTITSQGAEDEKSFNPKTIKVKKAHWRLGEVIKDSLQAAKFKRVATTRPVLPDLPEEVRMVDDYELIDSTDVLDDLVAE
ncbi:MAG: HU family DNA-binding protein [Streptococcaceae bacterium]|jgi:predicted histone-like DNA-binding protein|nr:HU family DNA-binding protein [Streptococcaceae bacterium]